ncbi:MAG: hypothetical protein NDJ89_01535 [Oligoflexia bacterium]|nr:hypothetical protein [Oligoflexia bacterium]
MVKAKYATFLPGLNMKSLSASHGGELSPGKRKSARPIDPKQALHIVMRSSKARGELSMLHPRHCAHIHALAERLASRWGVRLYRYANVGSHLHLLVKVPSRAVCQRFLRELAGGIAIVVTGAKKGIPLRKNASDRGFWDHLVFTRIVRFGRDYENVGRYLVKNLFEGAGVPMKRLLAEGLRILTVSQNGEIRGSPS